ncbi:MAG: cytochrome c biogenesis protein ResB [Cryobacterium sp.]|nr:cytochrome c biogenesis protein ResB [Micrococcales bacterium]MBX3308949.1 cytochrome c biogenesis protein ResB [Cryobacterium sp.]
MPALGLVGWARWIWRQLTSMKTALWLLVLLAIAAVPGSLVPQRTADPNGVLQYFKNNPDGARVLDSLQAFDVYTSVWFSAIYLLLFISLVGCVIPRTRHHWIALRAAPPLTPRRLSRMPVHEAHEVDVQDSGPVRAELVEEGMRLLRRSRYRVVTYPEPGDPTGASQSVSAERGYLRETGNLLFHVALVGILATIAIGGGYGYIGQRVVVEGQTFVNTRAAYDSFTPGRFFDNSMLDPYSLTLEKFSVQYEVQNPKALGMATDYTARVSVRDQGSSQGHTSSIKVNEPLSVGGTEVYLLGNGYAPEITVKDPTGKVVFSDTIPFLPQDANLTSLGVVKVPDGLKSQVGMIGFFYPTQAVAANGAFYSAYPDLVTPLVTFNVYTGDLGLDSGAPKSVYTLDTSSMTQVTGRGTGIDSLQLTPGQTVQLPNGLGSVELTGIKRFASFQVAHDPTQGFVFGFAIVILVGLALALFVPRRRLWVRINTSKTGRLVLEYAGLARGDDPGLAAAVTDLAQRHRSRFTNRD